MCAIFFFIRLVSRRKNLFGADITFLIQSFFIAFSCDYKNSMCQQSYISYKCHHLWNSSCVVSGKLWREKACNQIDAYATLALYLRRLTQHTHTCTILMFGYDLSYLSKSTNQRQRCLRRRYVPVLDVVTHCLLCQLLPKKQYFQNDTNINLSRNWKRHNSS